MVKTSVEMDFAGIIKTSALDQWTDGANEVLKNNNARCIKVRYVKVLTEVPAQLAIVYEKQVHSERRSNAADIECYV